jgi:carbamoyltransferase
MHWETPYLGHDIDRPFDTKAALRALLDGEVIGIANGRAEFGPRALGNRSLVADPRSRAMKDRVNQIKKRQQFRPFAPVILSALAPRYFNMPVPSSPYMQYTAPCREPLRFPAICHIDGSSRVQTLTQRDNPTFHDLLLRFYEATGCPILLNTSLNVRGEPLVNTWEDALHFSNIYGVKVF